jgi:hypothetical protein
MAIICSKCSATVQVYNMCDRDTNNMNYCDKCFASHPCGKGKHGEECPTSVFDDDPNVKGDRS